MEKTKLCVIVPCYNEQEVLPETVKRLGAFLDENSDLLSPESRVLFVDDGSRDDTWRLICAASEKDARFEGALLAHNRGHQNALWAGMDSAKGRFDCYITIDADLQDDINAMREMLIKHSEGADVVYGVRSKRETDSAFKRLTAESYYKFMSFLGAETVYNHADYRLLSDRALRALMEYSEVNLYLRGMVPLLGFKTETVYYERAERFAGESKYPLKKMLALAMQGATSFSTRPIRLIWVLGLAIFFAAALAGIALLCVPGRQLGFAAISVWLCTGLILAALGLVGEYAGKIYAEVKRRPRYCIMERAGKFPEAEKDK